MTFTRIWKMAFLLRGKKKKKNFISTEDWFSKRRPLHGFIHFSPITTTLSLCDVSRYDRCLPYVGQGSRIKFEDATRTLPWKLSPSRAFISDTAFKLISSAVTHVGDLITVYRVSILADKLRPRRAAPRKTGAPNSGTPMPRRLRGS